jgi:hypothetical protein
VKIEVEDIRENEDGTADYAFLFDEEALIAFAKLGIRAAVEKELARHGHTNTEGTRNAGSGESSDTDFHE